MAGLKREIGFFGAAFIALNGIVGAGIFAMPQALAEGAGAASPYLILVFGAAMACVALVFGELAARFDGAGGPVVYAGAAFGRFAGFQVGWLYYLARVSALAANTNALLTYFAVFWGGADQGVLRLAIIALLFAAFVALNVTGVRGAVRALNLLTVLKLAPLIILVGWGLVAFGARAPAPEAPSLGAAESVGLLLLYAFVGFEQATLVSGETRDAKRAMPRALIGVIAAITALYFLVQLAYVAIMQGRAPEIAPLAAAAEILAGPWAVAGITLAAMISIGGNLFSTMIAAPRITFAMGQEETLPRWFGAVNQHFATPANSILFLGLFAGAMAASGAFVWLAVMSALARLIVYFACTGALVRLRHGEARARRPAWRVALAWAAPGVAAGLCIWAGAQAEARAWAFVGGFALAGTALYALARWRPRPGSPI